MSKSIIVFVSNSTRGRRPAPLHPNLGSKADASVMQAIDATQWVGWIGELFMAQYRSMRRLAADEFHHRSLTLKSLLLDL
jgi:hypothetical protein